MIGRSVTVRIDETLWQHESAPQIDQEFSDETAEIPFYNLDGVRDGTFSVRTGQVLTD
jgi:hypothetical protein